MTFQELDRSTLSSEEIEHFSSQGFVRLRGLLSQATVERLRDGMDQALASFAQSASSYDITAMADSLWDDSRRYEPGGSEQHDLSAFKAAIDEAGHPRLVDAPRTTETPGRFLVDTSVWRRVKPLADFALQGPLGSVASQLLGAPKIRYFDDQLFIKEPFTADRAAFHQDVPYFNLDSDEGCVAWIPLDRVRKGGGSLGYVPGSHRWGAFNPNVFMSRAAFPGSNGRDLPDIDSDPERYNVQHIEADPGDVLVHHFLTVHCSEGNLTPNNRRAFSLRYCDAAIRYRARDGAPAQPLHEKNLHTGDELDPSIHPIVYP